jgi:DNA-binding transcriptional ArsR family regulator
MARRRPRTLRVDGVEALRALASPVRMEILNSLAGVGPASIAELARLLGRAPNSLYHHMEILVDRGLVVEAGTRPRGANTEQLYHAAAEQVGLRHDPADPERSSAIADAMAGNLKAAERDFRVALCEGTGRVRGRGKDTFGGRFKGWLDEEDRAELFEHIEAIATLFRRRQGATDGRLITTTLATAPAPVKRPRRED